MDVTVEPFAWVADLDPNDLTAATAAIDAAWADWCGDRPMGEAGLLDLDRFTHPPEHVERRLGRDGAGRVVGWGRVEWRDGEPGGSIAQVFVDPAHRRAGTATTLVGALVDAAREHGRTGLTLEVADDGPLGEVCARKSTRR